MSGSGLDLGLEVPQDVPEVPHIISTFQEQYISAAKAEAIKNGKNGIATPIIIYPPQPYDGRGSPILENFYLKPIIFCVPFLNFPSHSIVCGTCNT